MPNSLRPSPLHGFPRSSRLLTHSDYQRVFDHVDVKISSRSCLLLAKANDVGTPRIGFVISKKSVKAATQRNNIKRVTRDYFRLHRAELPLVDIVFIARHHLSGLAKSRIRAAVSREFARLIRRVNASLHDTGTEQLSRR